jgi:hypothetical protein
MATPVHLQPGMTVVLKPWGDRQTLRARLFKIDAWLSPGARAAELGVWPGSAIFGTYVLDGVWGHQSTSDIERLATDDDWHADA